MFKPSHPTQVPLKEFRIKDRTIHAVPRQHVESARSLAASLDTLIEPLLADGVHSYRRHRSVHTAVHAIHQQTGNRLSFDIKQFFLSIDQRRLKRQLDKLNPGLWRDIETFMPSFGLPTGPNFCPVLSNLYLNELDHRFGWIRYCDNIMLTAADPEKLFLKAERHLSDIGLQCHQVEQNPAKFCRQALEEPREEEPD